MAFIWYWRNKLVYCYCFFKKYIVEYEQPFHWQKGNPYLRMERGYIVMSSYDLILRLIEMLLAEKDKNYQLRDEKMNDKD